MAALDLTLSGAKQAAFDALPPGVQNTLTTMGSVYGELAPAVSLASDVASGKGVSDAAIVGGVAAVAGVTMGPIAGAAVATVGTLGIAAVGAITNLFDALGLYDHPAEYHYTGLVPDTVLPPFGPKDPLWIDVSTLAKLESFELNGDKTASGTVKHPPLSGASIDQATLSLLWNAYAQQRTPAQAAGAHTCANDFERFFCILLARNLQNWANAQAYVPPQKLLLGAVNAWNSSHASTKTLDYAAPSPDVVPTDLRLSLVSMVMGPEGAAYEISMRGKNVQNLPNITVNLGPENSSTVATARKVVTLNLSGLKKPAAPMPLTYQQIAADSGNALNVSAADAAVKAQLAALASARAAAPAGHTKLWLLGGAALAAVAAKYLL